MSPYLAHALRPNANGLVAASVREWIEEKPNSKRPNAKET
jgi:hypothetical protein